MNLADYNHLAAQDAWETMNHIDYDALPTITNLNQIGTIPKEFDDYGIKDALQIIKTQITKHDFSEVSLFKNVYGFYVVDDEGKIIYALPRTRVADNIEAIHIARVRTFNHNSFDYADFETWYRTTLNYFVKSLAGYNELLTEIGDNEPHDVMLDVDHPVINHNLKNLSIKNPKKIALNQQYLVNAATKVYETKGLPVLEEHFGLFNQVVANDGFDDAYNSGDYGTINGNVIDVLGLSDDPKWIQQGVNLEVETVFLTLPEPKYTIARRTKQAIQRNINLLSYELACKFDLNLGGV